MKKIKIINQIDSTFFKKFQKQIVKETTIHNKVYGPGIDHGWKRRMSQAHRTPASTAHH